MNSQNPLLAALVRIPGGTFPLPSKGMYYTNGELSADVVDGEVEVYPMTAYDEIVLNTPDKLLSGRGILEVIGRCVPQVLKPESLLARDVDYLMMCLRVVTLGEMLTVTYTPPSDDDTPSVPQKHKINLAELLKTSKKLDPTLVGRSIKMGNGQVVTLTPMLYVDVLNMYQVTILPPARAVDEEEEVKQLFAASLAKVVADVDGVTNKEFIAEWLIKLPMQWKRELETSVYELSNWGVDFVYNTKCQVTGQPIAIPIDANPVNFFM